MSEPSPPVAPPAAPSEAGRGRIIAAHVLVVLASLLAVLSLLAGYIRFQAFDDKTFDQASAQLIADPEIRDQVATTLVDQLYANVDVQAQLEKALPAGQQRLAGPLSAALRQLAYRSAQQLLARPRAQRAWVVATAAAHHRLLLLLDNKGKYVHTNGGVVVLDLRPLVIKVGDQVAVIGKLGAQLPPGSARITIIRSNQLSTVQKITKWLKAAGAYLWIITLLVAAAAVWLARGRRRRMVREVALGAATAGLLVIILRRLVGHYITTHLVATESVRPAVSDAWNILTRLLADGAWTLFFMALIALAWAWLAGETKTAGSARRALAGKLVKPELAFGAVLAFMLLIVWWGPTPQTHRWYLLLAATVILALGVEALRRQTAREAAAPSP